MRAIGGGGGETHFTVNVVSAEFEGKVRFLSTPSSYSKQWPSSQLIPVAVRSSRSRCSGIA